MLSYSQVIMWILKLFFNDGICERDNLLGQEDKINDRFR